MKPRDTSDRLVKHIQVRTLSRFIRQMEALHPCNPVRLDYEVVKQGLKEVVEATGTESLAYDSYVKGIQAFLGR